MNPRRAAGGTAEITITRRSRTTRPHPPHSPPARSSSARQTAGEVRGLPDELVCVTVYQRGAAEGCAGSRRSVECSSRASEPRLLHLLTAEPGHDVFDTSDVVRMSAAPSVLVCTSTECPVMSFAAYQVRSARAALHRKVLPRHAWFSGRDGFR